MLSWFHSWHLTAAPQNAQNPGNACKITRQRKRREAADARGEVRACRLPLEPHSLHPFKCLFKCSLSHSHTNPPPLSLVSFLSHINQIYSQNDHLFKADYLKESHLSNYNTTTLSTEPDIIPGVCICAALHTIYSIFLSACQHPRVHTRTSAFLPNLSHCNLFSRVHLHNCTVSLDTSFASFFFPINKYVYPLSNLHGTQNASAPFQHMSRRLPTKDLYLNAALSFTCLCGNRLCPIWETSVSVN